MTKSQQAKTMQTQDGTQGNKFGTIKEEDNESEEIKTEFSMYSDEDNSSSSDEENATKNDKNNTPGRGGSRRGSRKNSKEMISPLSNMRGAGLNNSQVGNGGVSPTKLPGGGIRLGVSVAAKNIETAEKYIKKDKQEALKEQNNVIT